MGVPPEPDDAPATSSGARRTELPPPLEDPPLPPSSSEGRRTSQPQHQSDNSDQSADSDDALEEVIRTACAGVHRADVQDRLDKCIDTAPRKILDMISKMGVANTNGSDNSEKQEARLQTQYSKIILLLP